jgi:hypothetical protein
LHIDEPPKGNKAIYPHTRFLSAVPFDIKARTSQFWLLYDEDGVVQDYGFVGEVPATASFAQQHQS